MNLEKVWKSALKVIKEEVPQSSFQAWIKPASLVEIAPDKAIIEVRNEFSRNLIIQNYHRSISKGLESSLGRQIDLIIRVNQNLPTESYVPSLSSLEEAAPVAQPSLHSLQSFSSTSVPQPALNTKFVFDNFIVGSHNQFCHAAALAIAEGRAQAAYNPFFVYGDVGLGKTHIMHSIGNYKLKKNPSTRVLYITAEKFLNDLIASMRKNKMNEFRARYRSLDLLLIDDIQFIEGKETTQEEFFHTFNALKDNGGQIVLTSDRPPSAISRLEPRLCSRFEGGLIADVQPPTYETRLAIISRKADELKMRVKPEIADLIARAFIGNVRRIEGALIKLQAYSSFTSKPLSVELAEHVLQIDPNTINASTVEEKKIAEVFLQESQNKPLDAEAQRTIENITTLVSSKLSIDAGKIMSRENSQEVKHARQVCMYIARTHGLSLQDISQAFDGRGNSSILNSCRRIAKEAKTDQKLKAMLEEILNEIKG